MAGLTRFFLDGIEVTEDLMLASVEADDKDPTGYLVVEAECGASWLMDYEPQPDWCSCEYWRLGVIGEGWGSWVDSEGNPRGD